MRGILFLAAAVLAADAPPSPGPIFADTFDRGIGPGWEWLRENPDTWRIYRHALEIRVEPGDANSVKNALVRPAPDRAKAPYAVEVTIAALSKPTGQFEQAGITLYIDKKPAFKMVKELVDGKRLIVCSAGSPGRLPMEADTVQLRLEVAGTDFTARFRPDGKGEWTTVSTGKLPPPKDDELSLQCYQGPPGEEHWFRFDDFRIVPLPAAKAEGRG